VVYDRRHTRLIAEYGGLFRVMPVFTIVFLIAVLSSMGLPPLNGFIGEVTVIRGVYEYSFWWALSCGIGIALGAAYLLWLFQRTSLGEVGERNMTLKDLSWREIAVFAPLLALVFSIGLYPKPYFDIMERSVAQVIDRVRPEYYDERGMVHPLYPPPEFRMPAPAEARAME
jgi:NADH-quinone oxidoreductase subunit M